MIIQKRCFNCDRMGPRELDSLESAIVIICLKCRPRFMDCFNVYIEGDPDAGQKEAILDVLQSILEAGPL